ncbi:MAG: tRNA epoxyqueuosine(34) reductase QueG [Gemmatimonas sp.]|nr:tRNA epoxyqueuosine(34) reductase QueG [Gemmatimonas sp.]
MATATFTGLEPLTERIRDRARELGFEHVGVAPLGPSEHAEAYCRWVDAGFAGEMRYLTREDAARKRADPDLVVPGARSAIVVAKNYFPGGNPAGDETPADRAIFARYARGHDYHELLKPRLIELQDWIAAELVPLGGRAYVDTGPVLERELAVRAGLGWFGKNTMLIRPTVGSYLFLGAILVDVELSYDEPFTEDRCGTCENCLTHCPTAALLGIADDGAPVMDARRCISYLTIELKGPIPRELRPLIGNRVYGCDICQEVCPHNNPKFVQLASESAFRPRPGAHGAELIEIMGIDQVEFSRRFKGSPVKRTKRRGLLRNVAVALGNWGSSDAVPALVAALQDHEPLIREHAAWALGQIASRQGCPSDGVSASVAAIEGQLAAEENESVREELSLALDEISGNGTSQPA